MVVTQMTSHMNTRATRANSSAAFNTTTTKNRSLAILGIRGNNENLARPPLPGKGGGGMKDSSNKLVTTCGVKRKGDALQEHPITKKRSVLGDVTNAIEKTISHGRREVQKLGMPKKGRNAAVKPDLAAKPAAAAATKTRGHAPATTRLSSVPAPPPATSVDAELAANVSYCEALPSSQELKLSLDSSAYVTASETSPTRPSSVVSLLPRVAEETQDGPPSPQAPPLPPGVHDYDQECELDPFAVALYASDIFEYYRQREAKFSIDKYLDRQSEITESMRAILVDWMVEVQESFELNHETLYLAVKLVDLYLSKCVISRDQLQLVGSTALFIACKFDERVPPYVDDFLYICDDAYKRKELITYEIKMLKTVDYDLGIPLSYRFLRRYARCAKVSMEELTLSRFILEMSLMEYSLLDASDCAVAAAALLLARCITAKPGAEAQRWTATLQHYSGFAVSDLCHLVHVLHQMLTRHPKENLKTVLNKYSHEVFYEVAKIPVPETLDL